MLGWEKEASILWDVSMHKNFELAPNQQIYLKDISYLTINL